MFPVPFLKQKTRVEFNNRYLNIFPETTIIARQKSLPQNNNPTKTSLKQTLISFAHFFSHTYQFSP